MAKTSITNTIWDKLKMAFFATILGTVFAGLLSIVLVPLGAMWMPIVYLIWGLLLVGSMAWMKSVKAKGAWALGNLIVVTLFMGVVGGVLAFVPGISAYLAWINLTTVIGFFGTVTYAMLALAVVSKYAPKQL